MDREQVVQELLLRFPELREELLDEIYAGLVHLEIACFARYTQQQIEIKDKTELRKCFETAHEFLRDGNDEVKNAIHVSYLEHLNFTDGKKARAWALKELSPLLRAGHENIMKYLEGLGKLSRKPT